MCRSTSSSPILVCSSDWVDPSVSDHPMSRHHRTASSVASGRASTHGYILIYVVATTRQLNRESVLRHGIGVRDRRRDEAVFGVHQAAALVQVERIARCLAPGPHLLAGQPRPYRDYRRL